MNIVVHVSFQIIVCLDMCPEVGLLVHMAILFLFYFSLINLFIIYFYFWLRWVFVAMHGLSLVTASGGYSSLRCMGFSLRLLLLLGAQAVGARASVVWHAGSVVVARGF